ncbi:MAG: SAM-dependent chlorinase/fluorinase [Deltaproteobacteria bacterium]|nr:SAM-dependent chlorinase/fluorinase [Deltaproteobacteria bacterium]
MPIITLSSDFGTADGYAAAMKGVILSICRQARLVDLSHDLPARDVLAAALMLERCAPLFPPGCVHLAVVDPGVGTSRLPIAFCTPDASFVGPDNGLFSLVWRRACAGRPEGAVFAVELADARFRREPVSPTFHGRDVFAPAAAHLACGLSPDDLGPRLAEIALLDLPEPERLADGAVCGQIIAVDHFGNCISNIEIEQAHPHELRVETGGRALVLRQTYAEVGPGEPLALIGSCGRLELTVRDGSYAEQYGVRVGDGLRVTADRADRPSSHGRSG